MGDFSSFISKVTSLIDEELMLVEFLTDKQYERYTSETSETKKQLLRTRRKREQLIHNAWLNYNYFEKVFFLQQFTYSFDSKLDNLKIPFVLECLNDENNTIQGLGSHLLFIFFCRLFIEKLRGSCVLDTIDGFNDFAFYRDFACLWGDYNYIESYTEWEGIVDDFFKNVSTNTIIQFIWDVTEFMTVNTDILSDSSIDCLLDFVFEGSLKQMLKDFSDRNLEDFALGYYELFDEENSRLIPYCCDLLIRKIVIKDFYYDSRLHTQDGEISQILFKLRSNQESDIQTDWIEYKTRLEYADDQLFTTNDSMWYDNMYLTRKLVDTTNFDECFPEDFEDDLDFISSKFDNMYKFSNTLKTQIDDEEEILNSIYNDETYIESILDDIDMFENESFKEDAEPWDL